MAKMAMGSRKASEEVREGLSEMLQWVRGFMLIRGPEFKPHQLHIYTHSIHTKVPETAGFSGTHLVSVLRSTGVGG